MTVEGLLAESNAINNFRFRQVEKFPHGAGDKLVFYLFSFSFACSQEYTLCGLRFYMLLSAFFAMLFTK